MNGDIMELMKALEEDLKCPVCLEQLTPPVLQCRSGHNTCSGCKKDGCEQCPLCREPFVVTINRVLDKMMNLLSKPCPYADKGCPLTVSDINHTQWCTFRPMRCPNTKRCEWRGSVNSWLSHVNTDHINKGVLFLNEPVKCGNLFYDHLYHGFTIKVNNNQYFFLTTSENSKNCEKVYSVVTVTYVPMKQPTEEYAFKIDIIDRNEKILDSGFLRPPMELDSCPDGMSFSIRLSMLTNSSNTVILTARKT